MESYGESWESADSDTCQECGKVLTADCGEHQHKDLDDDSRCDGWLNFSTPMMNYRYPIDSCAIEHAGGMEGAARLLNGLPLCVVHFNDTDEHALALTGGGMDLSWEICEAYTRLGQLPPVHFCDLPAMSGRGDSARDRYIIAACRESIRVQMNWGKNKLRSLRALTTRAKA